MTAGELLAIIRTDYLDDPVAPYAWSDAMLLREIGRAQQQACYRQDLRHLFDAETFTIELETGTRAYPLDPLILRIEEVSLNGSPLRHTTLADLDARWFGWRDYAAGTPRQFYIQGKTLYLDRAPDASLDGESLAFQVWREPLTDPIDLTEDDDLEWESDPEQLAHWVCFRAYMRRDEDTQDKAKAAEHLALFNATFGAEVPAKVRAELLAYPPVMNFAPARTHYPLASSDQEVW